MSETRPIDVGVRVPPDGDWKILLHVDAPAYWNVNDPRDPLLSHRISGLLAMNADMLSDPDEDPDE